MCPIPSVNPAWNKVVFLEDEHDTHGIWSILPRSKVFVNREGLVMQQQLVVAIGMRYIVESESSVRCVYK